MVQGFITGKYYLRTFPCRGPGWASEGTMDFVLDGKPHLCIYGDRATAKFEDDPLQISWLWDVERFDEVDPVTYKPNWKLAMECQKFREEQVDYKEPEYRPSRPVVEDWSSIPDDDEPEDEYYDEDVQ